jgi:hypothetical protein
MGILIDAIGKKDYVVLYLKYVQNAYNSCVSINSLLYQVFIDKLITSKQWSNTDKFAET